MVSPSTLVDFTASAPCCTPASRRRSAIGTPIQRALPAYGPPTSLDTQVRVMSRSISRRSSSSVEREPELLVDQCRGSATPSPADRSAAPGAACRRGRTWRSASMNGLIPGTSRLRLRESVPRRRSAEVPEPRARNSCPDPPANRAAPPAPAPTTANAETVSKNLRRSNPSGCSASPRSRLGPRVTRYIASTATTKVTVAGSNRSSVLPS